MSAVLAAAPEPGEERVMALATGLFRSLANGTEDVAEALIVVETMILGLFLVGEAEPTQIVEHLDAITQRVIERHAAAVAAGGGA
ncbi:MAG: hypothetical protein MUF14_05275 [Hyphomonadaceae bacterium]|jgi:hypothetical protein|nr:hypothetical protein [Hyphomonadaceae bacterium]